jgi:hypothetical protein
LDRMNAGAFADCDVFVCVDLLVMV